MTAYRPPDPVVLTERDPEEHLGVYLRRWLRTARHALAPTCWPSEGDRRSAWLGPSEGWRDVQVIKVQRWGAVRVAELGHGPDGDRLGPPVVVTVDQLTSPGSVGSVHCKGPSRRPCRREDTLQWRAVREVARTLDDLPPSLAAQMNPVSVPRSRLWEVLPEGPGGAWSARDGRPAWFQDGRPFVTLLGAVPTAGRDPYAHEGPVIAKLLHDAIERRPGRPSVGALEKAFRKAVELPQPGEPHVELPRRRPSWRSFKRSAPIVRGLDSAASVLGDVSAARIAKRISALPAELRPAVAHDDPSVWVWPSAEEVIRWWARVHRCTRLGLKEALGCEQGHTGLRWLSCGRADCTMCQPRVQRRRGRRKFAQLGGSDLGHFVATLPPALVRRAGVAQVAGLRDAWRGVLDEWARVWHGAEIGQLLAVHPCGDESPDYRPHFDGVALLEARSISTGEYFALEPMRDLLELDFVRLLWAGVCMRAMRLAGVRLDERVGSHVNVWYGFATADKPGKVQHLLGYLARSFPAWSAGSWPRSLSQARALGLASPAAVRQGIAEWRERIRGELVDEPTPCFEQGCDCHLASVQVGEWAYMQRMYPWAVDLDELCILVV